MFGVHQSLGSQSRTFYLFWFHRPRFWNDGRWRRRQHQMQVQTIHQIQKLIRPQKQKMLLSEVSIDIRNAFIEEGFLDEFSVLQLHLHFLSDGFIDEWTKSFGSTEVFIEDFRSKPSGVFVFCVEHLLEGDDGEVEVEGMDAVFVPNPLKKSLKRDLNIVSLNSSSFIVILTT